MRYPSSTHEPRLAEVIDLLDKYIAANDNQPDPAQGPRRTTRQADFIQVYSGRQFWPMDPRPDEIHIEDIAHSLSLQCRYAGHCERFLSVAEHSTLMARHLAAKHAPEVAMWALLHDASEAYLVDVPRPVKPYLTGYKDAEARIMDAVAVRFGLPKQIPVEVKDADDRIIADELVNLRRMEWHTQHDKPLGVRLRYWSPDKAETEFLATYVALERAFGRAA